MGLTNTLHCSVSGRGISGLLRSGVLLLFIRMLARKAWCLLILVFFAFFLVIFGFSLPTSVLRCVIFVRNVISRTRFLDWIYWRGECPSVGPLPLPKIVSKLSVRASACGLLFRDPDHLTVGEILYRLTHWDVTRQGHNQRDEILSYLTFGVDVCDFFLSRAHIITQLFPLL